VEWMVASGADPYACQVRWALVQAVQTIIAKSGGTAHPTITLCIPLPHCSQPAWV
jgi:hypothetical protein